jgi:hypothetical protein
MFHFESLQVLLRIASGVEAAVASYMSVMPVTDTERIQWAHFFDQERVSSNQLSLVTV